MTHKEFIALEQAFIAEDARWNALYPGQEVYDSGPWEDYFKIIIHAIDVENRVITGLDTSQSTLYPPSGKLVELSHFYTVEELKRVGVEFIN